MNTTITADTTVVELVDLWLQQLRTEGQLENTTINEYERVLRKLVVPELGNLGLHALTTSRIDVVLANLATKSVNRQRKAKVVAGAMLDAALEGGAISANPVRGSMSVSRPKPAARELTVTDLETLRTGVHAWMTQNRPGPKASGDMADLIELMLATGARVGEVLALRWSDLDFDARWLSIDATIKTESGKGTYRKSLPNARTVELTDDAVAILRRRQRTARTIDIEAVFPTRNGTWQQVNNVERRWRQIRQEAGLEWVTPDAFRRNAGKIRRQA